MKEAGYTAPKLAEITGCTKDAIYHYLAGRRVPKPDVMRKLIKLSEGQIDANTFYVKDMPKGYREFKNALWNLRKADPSKVKPEAIAIWKATVRDYSEKRDELNSLRTQ